MAVNADVTEPVKTRARIIAVTSGKGGVGKTNTSTNIGIQLARLGNRVCIFDADLGLANINILIGKAPEYTIEHLMIGQCTLDEIIMSGPGGIDIVPASSGVERLAELTPSQMEIAIEAFGELETRYDYILIDTSAGIAPTVLSFIGSAQEAWVVVTPEPTSMTDSYALIKVLQKRGFKKRISILANQVSGREQAVKLFSSIQTACHKFLDRKLHLLGYVVKDYALATSVVKQVPVSLSSPDSGSAKCFRAIGEKIVTGEDMLPEPTLSGFWGKLFASRAKKTTPTPKWQRVGLGDLVSETIKRLEHRSTTPEQAKAAITNLEEAFKNRFGRSVRSLRELVLEILNEGEKDSQGVKKIVSWLESGHLKKYGRPLKDESELLDEMIAGCNDNSELLSLLVKVESAFAKRTDNKTSYLSELLTRTLKDESFDEAGFWELINRIRDIHSERYGLNARVAEPVGNGDRIEDKVEPVREAKSEAKPMEARSRIRRRFERLMTGVQ